MPDEPDQLYERLLVIRCQAGDEEAFAQIVSRYQPRLRYYARRMLYGLCETDDLLQEVWFDVFRAIPQLQEVGAFRAWLYRIARARVSKVFRRRRLAFEEFNETQLSGSNESLGILVAEQAETVHRALGQLAPAQREVLVLHYIEGMTCEQIAQVVECPVGTVRSRLHYGRLALRHEIEGDQRHE